MAGKRDIFLEHYSLAFAVTALIMFLAVILGGGHVIVPILALAVIEVTFSFENAVINSEVLKVMNRFWRVMFLTIGIAVAVFGVRLILPLVLVSLSAGHSVSYVLDLALHQPDVYAHELEAAYPVIAAFGGVFLLMIGLRFFGEKKEVFWLKDVESPVAEFNQPWWVSLSGAALAVMVIYFFLAPHNTKVALAGVAGAVVFVIVKAISLLLVRHGKGTYKHGFLQFIYLELLDATFSFDGVLAAFAITREVLLIVAGLGIGALYVRSITVHLLKAGTLTQYRYLIHGAHYAISILAILLITSIRLHIPQLATGFLGLIIIAFSFESSRRFNSSQAIV